MVYTIKEIIDIAIEMEIAGYDFYMKVAEKFDTQGVRDTFKFLANQEIKHRKYFEKMNVDQDNTPGVFNEEYYLYLKAIGGDQIYPKNKNMDEIVSKIHTPVEALTKAFHDEKQAVLFYSEIKNLYDDNSEIAKILDEIIEEERKHAFSLWEIKEKMSGS